MTTLLGMTTQSRLFLNRHLFDELVAERTSGPEALLLQRHVLFGLRVKRGVFNQAVYKHPHVVLHLQRQRSTLGYGF